MPLKTGTRLGPYEIVAPLGAGGMGEVYRASDTRLARDIAIKVLAQGSAATDEERARFAREAKSISGLNHPHICVLHDIGREGETDYLVMELVEGETLARRIARGALPTADVLRLGSQIADALDRAHRAGVVHRDLKPGNIMLTKSGAKLMDFGLARQVARAPFASSERTAAASLSHARRADGPITAEGTVVGTYQYMAPEQLEGAQVDARSDIWALGCVLYEMATGRRAFEGGSAASVISAILRDPPRALSELAPLTPPAFERTVLQCLAKDPDDRWQSAGDIRRDLEWIARGGSGAGPSPSRRAWPTLRSLRAPVLVAAIAAAAGVAGTLLFRPQARPPAYAFEIAAPEGVRWVDMPRLSPDGKMLAFNAMDSSGVRWIWLRPMNEMKERKLAGTEGAWRPFWSPDSRSIAFFAGGRLMKIDVDGGTPVMLCESQRGSEGTWGTRGFILFDGAMADSVLMVPASGGVPRAVTRDDPTRGEVGQCAPCFLPDGRHFLYVACLNADTFGRLEVGSIDSPETRDLGRAESRVEYADGSLYYVSRGTLVERPFDLRNLSFRGEPHSIAEGVEAEDGGDARFSVAANRTIAYHSATTPGVERMVWFDRRGRRLGEIGPPGYYANPRLSPKGALLAVSVSDAARQHSQVWVWDVARNVGSRISLEDRPTQASAWAPDGRRLVYGRPHGVGGDLVMRDTARPGVDSVLATAGDGMKEPAFWSSDGRWIGYTAPGSSNPGDIDILVLPTRGGAPITLESTRFRDFNPALSPDGRALAYVSNSSGSVQVYVREFPDSKETIRVSTSTGIQPTWRGDGRELFYLAVNGDLMAAAVTTSPRLTVSRPVVLFRAPLLVAAQSRNQYEVTSDGLRFLLVAREGAPSAGVTRIMTR